MVSDSRCLGRLYRDGDVICRQGELADCMYVIQEGQAEVMVRHGEKEFCLAVLGAGDYFGQAELLEQGARLATLRAVGSAAVLTIDRRTFLRQLHEDPSLGMRVIRNMSRRIHHLEQALMRSADLAALEEISLAVKQALKL
jgi:CRP-like cAMP-binding protein